MMKIILGVSFLTVAMISNVLAGEVTQGQIPTIKKYLMDELVDTRINSRIENGFNLKNLHKANLSCGLAPLPPLGCVIGSCVCDQNGNNCHWQFNCQ